MPLFSIPSSGHAVGDGGHVTDHDDIAFMLSQLDMFQFCVLNAAYAGGADPTGINDSTAAFQQALNAQAGSVTGGLLYIPGGKYKISGTLTWTSVNSLYILGDGEASQILRASAAAPFHTFDIQNVTAGGITIANLQIINTVNAGSFADDQVGIYVSNCNRVRIENVHQDGAGNRVNIAVQLNNVIQSSIIGCDLRGYVNSVIMTGGSAVLDIIASQLSTNSGSGIATAGNVVMNVNAGTLHLDGVTTNSGDHGLVVMGGSGAHPAFVFANDLEINNPHGHGVVLTSGAEVWLNQLWASDQGIPYSEAAYDGIYCDGTFQGWLVVTDSTIQHFAGTGITLLGGASYWIANTSFSGCCGHSAGVDNDIFVASGVSNVTISGCHFDVDLFNSIQSPVAGVNISPGVTSYQVYGNIFAASGYSLGSCVDGNGGAAEAIGWRDNINGLNAGRWVTAAVPANTTGTVRYRLLNPVTVMVDVSLTVAAGAAAGALTLATLAAAYTPASTHRGPVGYFSNAETTVAGALALQNMRWHVSAAGSLQILAFPGGASGSGVTEVDFCVTYPLDLPVPISEDASTPPILMRALASGGTATTAAFSPPAGSLVLVAAVWMWSVSSLPGALTCSDSQAAVIPRIVGQDYVRPPLWWHKPFLVGTSSGIFRRYYATAPGPITVTVRSASPGPASAYVAARVVTGAAPAQSGAGMAHHAEAGDVSADLWTPGSWAYCCGGRPGTAAPIPGPNTTQIGAWEDGGTGATAAVGRLTGQNTHRGVHRLGWIQNISELSVLEVLPVTLPVPPQPVITAYEVVTADLMNNWLTPASQVKAASTPAPGTVQQPDPDLSVPVQPNAYYTWKAMLLLSGAVGADMVHSFAVPAGSSGGYILRRQDATQAWGTYATGITASVTSYTPAAGQNGVEMDGFLYTGATAGSLTLQWAAGSPGPAGQAPATLGAGSYLTVTRAG